MEIIMTQMRKFEQEAIATEIYEKIQATNNVVQKELEQTKDYKAIQSLVDELSDLQNQVDELNKNMKNVRDYIGESVSIFNEKISENSFQLSTVGSYYNNSGQLTWTDNHWDTMRNIERKLAIALISPDWKDKLSSIIDDIASQFGA
jgi:uncharacterized protein YoxC